MCLFSPFKKYTKELAELYAKKHELDNQDDGQILPGSDRDNLINQIDSLIEGDYSRAVFEYYSKKQPVLVRNRTGEIIFWKDAFGETFENVSKSLRHSLVGLVEGGGRYRLK